MAKFDRSVITQLGAALLAKMESAGSSLVFTKVEAGDGQYTEEEELRTRTGLKSKKLEGVVSLAQPTPDGATQVSAILTNEDLVSGCHIHEVGLYAHDPDAGDVLFAISVVASQTEADFLPTYDGSVILSINEVTYIKLSASSSVTIESVTEYASAEDLEELETIVTGMNASGIGDGHLNLWPSSRNLTSINPSWNGGVFLVNDLFRNLTGCPNDGIHGGGERFVAYRRQSSYGIDGAQGYTSDYYLIELIEIKPVKGRRWSILRNPDEVLSNSTWIQTDAPQQSGTLSHSGLTLSWSYDPVTMLFAFSVSGTVDYPLPGDWGFFMIPLELDVSSSLTKKFINLNNRLESYMHIEGSHSTGHIELHFTDAQEKLTGNQTTIGIGETISVTETVMLFST